MQGILVDSNVILDIFTEDENWFSWSSQQLKYYAEQTHLIINPIIYAEVSVKFSKIEELEEVLSADFFTRNQLPWEAAFLAGKAFQKYRQSGENKILPLPDFFIGAHALVSGFALLTRDKARYSKYFPNLSIIAPEKLE